MTPKDMKMIPKVMKGPFPLTDKGIDDAAVNEEMGCFVLVYTENKKINVKFTDRSDNLKQKLKTYVGKNNDYKEFYFFHSNNVIDVYRKVCRIYHKCNPEYNKDHPKKPDLPAALPPPPCPVCKQ
jgi:hypothetical protein